MPRMTEKEVARFSTTMEQSGKVKLKQVHRSDKMDGRAKDRQRDQRRQRAAEKRGD